MKIKPKIKLTAIAALAAAACTASGIALAADQKKDEGTKILVASIHPTEGNDTSGVVTFTQTSEGVAIRAQIRGLRPNAKHAIHIHEFGDLSAADATSAGDHFNPDKHDHGLPGKEDRHAGDLGNLEADENGVARYEFTSKTLHTSEGSHSILGRSLVIHAKADDGGQPSGNAGDRIAIGIIGYKNPAVADLRKAAVEKAEKKIKDQ